MESFVYDYYGYSIKEIKEGQFEYENYIFILAATTENEKSIENLASFTQTLNDYFPNKVVYIVKNKYNKFVSSQEDGNNICLLTYNKNINITINDFVDLNIFFLNFQDYKISLNEIVNLWEQRVEYILNQCLNNLNFDNESHVDLYEFTNYAIGFAYNAIQYLSDLKLDYKGEYNTTLTHRRIKKITSFELYNPFNLIIDHSSRDLSELYKNKLIDLKTLIEICTYYNYQENEYQYLLARLLFPTIIFDLIEDINQENNYNYTKEIYQTINLYKEQLKLVQEYYFYIKSIMNIRLIRWLEY